MRTIEADERAVRATLTLVSRVTTTDLDLATPCAGWDLGTLLAHMTAQHRGFAAAAAGRGADPEVWRTTGRSPHEYAQAAEQVIAAFAADGVPDREFMLPELSPHQPIPAPVAIGFHLVDYVVHGWDVARTLGLAWSLPEDVLAAALPIARAAPAGDWRLAPGAAFAPALPVPSDADTLTKIVAILGRCPAWSPPKIVGANR
jgi:uncharacterized protein (TIGR03086 family)